MSIRVGAPYADQVLENGNVLIYEGHNISKTKEIDDPKRFDQPMTTPSGRLTQNGLFHVAAKEFQNGKRVPERVKVYEKLRNGIWVYNGIFHLMDSRMEISNNRRVFRFRLELASNQEEREMELPEIDHVRIIPSSVKAEVWKRDGGRCVQCGSRENLHFDHIIPYSKGGSSLAAENIQLLCARHNLAKRDKIE
jgi:5-methylcytosine-specific restriction endonuclease McrA